jgi:hypothetical protein
LKNGLGSTQRALLPVEGVFVRDMSSDLINCLGPTFNLSPETFEEHLVQSGYNPYADDSAAGPSTWPTRFLAKPHVSLSWFSVVVRKSLEPRNMSRRLELLREGLKSEEPVRQRPWPFRSEMLLREQHLRALTNIFRPEWRVSALLHRAPRHKSQGVTPDGDLDGDFSEYSEDEENDLAAEADNLHHHWKMYLSRGKVAWEERVTFCWGTRGQERHREFVVLVSQEF